MIRECRGPLSENPKTRTERHMGMLPNELIELLKLSGIKLSGRGMFGRVFVGISERLGGRKVAIKTFVNAKKSQQEGTVYKRLKSIRERLPDNLARHLIEVIAVLRLGERDYIVLEALESAPDVVLQNLMDSPENETGARAEMLSSPEELHNVYKYVVEYITDLSFDTAISRFSWLRPVEKVWLNASINRHGEISQRDIKRDLLFRIRDVVNIKSLTSQDRTFIQRIVDTLVSSLTWRRLSRELGVGHWTPLNPRVNHVADSAVAEKLTELGIALKELGVSPYDVHRGNVMMRPGTNDLVVSDVGNFKLIGLQNFLDLAPNYGEDREITEHVIQRLLEAPPLGDYPDNATVHKIPPVQAVRDLFSNSPVTIDILFSRDKFSRHGLTKLYRSQEIVGGGEVIVPAAEIGSIFPSLANKVKNDAITLIMHDALFDRGTAGFDLDDAQWIAHDICHAMFTDQGMKDSVEVILGDLKDEIMKLFPNEIWADHWARLFQIFGTSPGRQGDLNKTTDFFPEVVLSLLLQGKASLERLDDMDPAIFERFEQRIDDLLSNALSDLTGKAIVYFDFSKYKSIYSSLLDG
jgi:hypothetical protein